MKDKYEEDDLRPARGVLFGSICGVCIWTVLFLFVDAAWHLYKGLFP